MSITDSYPIISVDQIPIFICGSPIITIDRICPVDTHRRLNRNPKSFIDIIVYICRPSVRIGRALEIGYVVCKISTVGQNVFPTCPLVVIGIAISKKVVGIDLIFPFFRIGITGPKIGWSCYSITEIIDKTWFPGSGITSIGIPYHIVNLIKRKPRIVYIIWAGNNAYPLFIIKIIEKSV